jgi:carbon storage regulator CsrA
MLVLSRKVNQEILIGDGISITIIAIRGKQVRVGIKAPPNVPIRRDELEPLSRADTLQPMVEPVGSQGWADACLLKLHGEGRQQVVTTDTCAYLTTHRGCRRHSATCAASSSSA